MDVATGWTECFPLVVREAALVVEALELTVVQWRALSDHRNYRGAKHCLISFSSVRLITHLSGPSHYR